MRTGLCAVLVVGCTLGHAGVAAARDFCWKVTGRTGAIYLVGSVHLLTQDFYPVSAAMEAAFNESDVLVEEADLGELLSPQMQMQMLTRGMLPADSSLDQVVSPATFAQVSSRIAQLGLPVEPLKRFKPWSLALTLAALEWQKAGFDADLGLDRHFYDRARKEGKRVQGLETAEYQLARFDGLSSEQQERLLAETLTEFDTEMANVSKIAQAWKVGDTVTIERIVLRDIKRDPEIYERLLVERNRNWLPDLENLLGRSTRAFVVVGAAHMVGPDGLIAMLKAKGYHVEQQ
jgi:uncharacterized protein YbaP (TraB family)